jgi:60 kDa SS-A/Ro ribonucleoprotein
MARFNQKTPNQRRTVNEEGAVAYKMSPEEQVYVNLMTGFFSPRFYEDPDSGVKPARGRRYSYSYGFNPDNHRAPQDEAGQRVATIHRLKELDAQFAAVKDTNFLMNLLVYSRNEGNIRTASCAGVAILANQGRLRKELVPLVARRADEPMEIAAIWQHLAGREDLKKMPNSLKKGLALAERALLTEYSAGKYKGKGITHLDLLRLTHPRPKNAEQEALFKMIKEGTVPTPETWETMISAAGSDSEAKRAAWEKWVDNGPPYMAALRNLRNLLKSEVSPAHLKKVIDLLGDKEKAAKAMQFPFRFWSAYRMLAGDRRMGSETIHLPVDMKGLFGALENGIQASVGAIPGWDFLKTQRILIAGDTSGSMQKPVSPKSTVELYHIALLMGYLLQTALPNVTVGMFGDRWLPLPQSGTVLDATMAAYNREGEVGYSTNGHAVIHWATEKKIKYDLFMFFSDMQMWNDGSVRGFRDQPGRSPLETALNTYKMVVNRDAKLVLFNLEGYSTVPVDLVRPDVAMVAGWSDKVFDVLGTLFTGENFLDQFRKPLPMSV